MPRLNQYGISSELDQTRRNHLFPVCGTHTVQRTPHQRPLLKTPLQLCLSKRRGGSTVHSSKRPNRETIPRYLGL